MEVLAYNHNLSVRRSTEMSPGQKFGVNVNQSAQYRNSVIHQGSFYHWFPLPLIKILTGYEI
jgi:hypothetical protein